jgi:hypothetical protein
VHNARQGTALSSQLGDMFVGGGRGQMLHAWVRLYKLTLSLSDSHAKTPSMSDHDAAGRATDSAALRHAVRLLTSWDTENG